MLNVKKGDIFSAFNNGKIYKVGYIHVSETGNTNKYDSVLDLVRENAGINPKKVLIKIVNGGVIQLNKIQEIL